MIGRGVSVVAWLGVISTVYIVDASNGMYMYVYIDMYVYILIYLYMTSLYRMWYCQRTTTSQQNT